MKSIQYLAVATVFGAMALAGPQDNSLVVGASQEPKVLGGDVLNVISTQSIKTEIENYLLPPLIVINEESDNQAVLVTEVPTTQNGRVTFSDAGKGKRKVSIRLTLKDGLKWSDGKPFTTDDIKLYYEMGKAPGMPTPVPDYWERVSLQVADDRNFTVTFEPAYFTDLIGAPMGYAPAHVMRAEWDKTLAQAKKLNVDKDAEKISDLYRAFFNAFSTPQAINAGKMPWMGPFRVTRWVPGNSVQMQRNPNFTAVSVPGGSDKYLQRVTYRFIQNTNTLLVSILGGSIDATSSVALSFDQARSPQLTSRAKGRFDIWFIPSPTFEHIEVNQFDNVQQVKDLSLDDPRTRQAILYAINRDELVKALFNGLQPVANAWMVPANPLYNPNVTKYPYNPAKAKQLLADLGWKAGPDGILTRNGKRFEIEFVTTAGNAVRERVQQFIANNLRQVGIAVKINNAPSAVVFADDYSQRASEGRWTGLFMFAWNFSLAEDGSGYQYKDYNTGAIFAPTKDNNYTGQNVAGWHNDEYDRLVSQGKVEFDAAKRKQLYAQAQEIWAKDVAAIPLYFRSNAIVVREGLVNYVTSTYSGGYGYPGWNAWEIGWASRGAQKRLDQAKYARAFEQ